jgi:hypothetical protein
LSAGSAASMTSALPSASRVARGRCTSGEEREGGREEEDEEGEEGGMARSELLNCAAAEGKVRRDGHTRDRAADGLSSSVGVAVQCPVLSGVGCSPVWVSQGSSGLVCTGLILLLYF